MCKVLKSYGTIAEHGNKVLALQTILDGGEKTLSLVSYKDGMSVANRNLTKEESAKLFILLSTYLNYKPVTEKAEPEAEDKEEVSELFDATETKRGIIHTLTTLPSGDNNYYTALEKATKEDIEQAIEIMKNSGGRHSTRIKVCENALRKISKQTKATPVTPVKTETKTEVKAELKKEEPKIVTFPTEDKKPTIIPLKTEGDRTYGECIAKLTKEKEQFKDEDSQYVITGLMELAKVDADFRNNLMREDKSYGAFMEFMFKAAQNGYCVRYGNVGWLDRDTALALAIDYYNHDEVKQKEIEDAEKAKRAEEAKKAKELLKKGAGKNGKVKANGKKKSRIS